MCDPKQGFPKGIMAMPMAIAFGSLIADYPLIALPAFIALFMMFFSTLTLKLVPQLLEHISRNRDREQAREMFKAALRDERLFSSDDKKRELGASIRIQKPPRAKKGTLSKPFDDKLPPTKSGEVPTRVGQPEEVKEPGRRTKRNIRPK